MSHCIAADIWSQLAMQHGSYRNDGLASLELTAAFALHTALPLDIQGQLVTQQVLNVMF